MPITEKDVVEKETPEISYVPEVEVNSDEAIIRIKSPEGVEERKVKLPKTTWG